MHDLLGRIDKMALPQGVKKDLALFAGQLLQLYQKDLLSLMVIGSAATGSYREKESDLNLLVIYSDLNIADLDAVARLARKWLKKRRFAPRFLSRRNLLSSAKVFPLDTLDMKERHVVLYGENLLDYCAVDAPALAWQVSTELKSMRLRIKQQFWRASGDPFRMASIISERFSSVLLLGRGLLYLEKQDPGASPAAIVAALIGRFGLEAAVMAELQAVRSYPRKLNREAGLRFFAQMMDIIRVLDDRAEELRQ